MSVDDPTDLPRKEPGNQAAAARRRRAASRRATGAEDRFDIENVTQRAAMLQRMQWRPRKAA
jgi:hypothetical protein